VYGGALALRVAVMCAGSMSGVMPLPGIQGWWLHFDLVASV
jgi:hypothetical protein